MWYARSTPCTVALLTGASIKLPSSSCVNMAAITAIFVLYLPSKVTKTPGHRCSMAIELPSAHSLMKSREKS